MALQSNDLFVVQSQTDNKLYSLKVSDLDTYLEGSSGIQFRGSVNLNTAPSAQTPPIITAGDGANVNNGDLYIVESDAAGPLATTGWVMVNGETEASENDRIIWDSAESGWVLVAGGSSTGGTLTGITASLPLKSDGDLVNPVLTIRQARTDAQALSAGDGEGTAGAVAKLATASDVASDNDTPDATAVVTADLLNATNKTVQELSIAAGGVTTVSTADANGNSALSVSPTSGNVLVEIKTSATDAYGVVQIASESDITDGTAGAGAVVDASQLKALKTEIDGLDTGVTSVTTTDANDNAALTISPTTGAVIIEIANAKADAYGVVQLASASDITNGTSGVTAVVDAAQLKAVSDTIPDEGIQSIAEGGTDIVTGALAIDSKTSATIGVNTSVFCPFNFADLTDIMAGDDD